MDWSKKNDALARTLSRRDFDPLKYAHSISKESDGDKDLIENRQRVKMLGEQTAQILKKQVYKNYQLFIDTAKEISFLEGEMFQLNNILTDQKSLMDDMIKTFQPKDQHAEEKLQENKFQNKNVNKELERKKIMKSLLTKVEDCESVVNDPSRYLVHDGDAVELDMDSFQNINKFHLFLFNDCLMLTTPIQSTYQRGRGKQVASVDKFMYKFVASWQIDTLAMVNARDIAQRVKNAFKILVFANARMFQCENAKEKREWIEVMDLTKRQHLSEESNEPKISQPKSPISPIITKNPFELTSPTKSKVETLMEGNNVEESRVLTSQFNNEFEDLDVFIAQRMFEKAVDSLLKLKKLVSNIPSEKPRKNCEEKLEARNSQLVDVLCSELKSTPDRSLRRGCSVLRRPVTLLIKQGQVFKACDLFLKNRSSAIEFALQQLRTEGSITLFINKLSKIFFSNINETADEFQHAFGEISGCFSAFGVWVESEMRTFVNKLSEQVFSGNQHISDIAECVHHALLYCSKLQTRGLDLNFLLNNLLHDQLSRSIKGHRQKVIDATNLRNSEEIWRQINTGTPQAAEKLVEEMRSLGLNNFGDFKFDGCFFNLTTSSIAFTRALLSHVDACTKISTLEMEKLILKGIYEIEICATQFIVGCLNAERSNKKKFSLIKQNAKFLAISVFPLVETKIKKHLNHKPKDLEKLRTSFLQEVSK